MLLGILPNYGIIGGPEANDSDMEGLRIEIL